MKEEIKSKIEWVATYRSYHEEDVDLDYSPLGDLVDERQFEVALN